jgi:hypothetical protein
MASSWTRAAVLFTLAALLMSGACYGACAAGRCGSPESASSGCHRHHSRHSEPTSCAHQHSDFVGPKIGFEDLHIAAAGSIVGEFRADGVIAVSGPPELCTRDCVPFSSGPPAAASPVLRI